MPGLTLREEFRGKRLKGTAIELPNDQHTGTVRIKAKQFLKITYPQEILLRDGGKPAGLFHPRIT